MEKDLKGLLVGGFAGFVLGGLAIIGFGGPKTHEVKIFRQEGKPTLMRIYRPGMDDILLEDPENKERFSMPLWSYLSTIEDQADRELEEARIKKQVDWYK